MQVRTKLVNEGGKRTGSRGSKDASPQHEFGKGDGEEEE